MTQLDKTISRALRLFRNIRSNSELHKRERRTKQVRSGSFWWGLYRLFGLTQPVPVSGANPDALTFSHGDRMYQYTVFATIAKQEIELKTFFDDLDEKPMEKAKALIEANKGKFRSMRIEKRITPML
jgi:hypothetical protein